MSTALDHKIATTPAPDAGARSALGQAPDGRYIFVTAEGEVVPGPLLQIGNTTSRVDFGGDPGLWVNQWSQTGISHHSALCVGPRAADIKAAASLLGIEHCHVVLS